MHLAASIACLAVVAALYLVTLGVWGRRYGFHFQLQQQGQQQQGRHGKALWRLVAILACFLVTWGLVVGNDLAAVRKGQGGARPVGDVPSAFMTIIDAIILGDVLAWCHRRRRRSLFLGAGNGNNNTAAGKAAAGGARHGGTTHTQQQKAAGRRSSAAASSAWRRSYAGLLRRGSHDDERAGQAERAVVSALVECMC